MPLLPFLEWMCATIYLKPKTGRDKGTFRKKTPGPDLAFSNPLLFRILEIGEKIFPLQWMDVYYPFIFQKAAGFAWLAGRTGLVLFTTALAAPLSGGSKYSKPNLGCFTGLPLSLQA